jgi:sugar/nucleoside kinase (ribokinase family)
MHLIDAGQADALYAAMGPGTERSGGSAANTIAGFASFGGRGAFIGRVADDQFGKVFAHDIRAAGVTYDTAPAKSGAPTALCLIFVTPDGERTMNTFLGASTELGTGEVDAELIMAAKVTYLEGYLFDKPEAKQAFHRAAALAAEAGRKTALTLSDAFCVDRHRDDFRKLVHEGVDILFANETEITALFQVNKFAEAVAAVRGSCDVAVLTRSDRDDRRAAEARRPRDRRHRCGRSLRRRLSLRPHAPAFACRLRPARQPRRRRGHQPHRGAARETADRAGAQGRPAALTGCCPN